MAFVALFFYLKLHQMEVITSFLNGNMEETIYMVQTENFVSGDPKNTICKRTKTIYGLKKASCQCKSH